MKKALSLLLMAVLIVSLAATAFADGDTSAAGSQILILSADSPNTFSILSFDGSDWQSASVPLNLNGGGVQEVTVRAIADKDGGSQIAAITVDGVTTNIYSPSPQEGTVPIDITFSADPADNRVPSSRCVKEALDRKADLSDLQELQETVNEKASQADLESLTETVGNMADTLADKADTQALENLAEAINGKADFSTQFMIELRGARVSTGGVSVASGSLPNDAKLICQRSHPIGDVLKQMMKESDNLYAESTYYQIAASSGGRPATAKDAQKLEENLLVRIGLDPSRYRLADGSGLSLYNYLTAEAQVRLLRYAWFRDEIYQQLLPTLPIAGEDGTLKKRMTDTAAQGNVQAKTGSVTGVSALTGYLTAPNGHRLAFSIINQGVRRMAEGRDFQDRLCEALCQP